MQTTSDRSHWHSLSLRIPLPSPDQARILQRVIQVDKPLRPSQLERHLSLDGHVLVASFRAATVAQARVALDHFLSDVELVVQTLHRFAPHHDDDPAPAPAPAAAGNERTDAPSLEVGLEGSWEGVRRR
ncbi:transcription factor Pcc1-domain-containing protein [Rhodotorula diobovata]|uniref:Transcription factor Pcc1-domain-containing protein n=1 Tax=Rhodotorula diobovata TaxID=5288 RepID=A0A5C5G276_9BASI|nr:transcription factor Pcc1-domain-containing protein [Rhodotorula diobovata]